MPRGFYIAGNLSISSQVCKCALQGEKTGTHEMARIEEYNWLCQAGESGNNNDRETVSERWDFQVLERKV